MSGELHRPGPSMQHPQNKRKRILHVPHPFFTSVVEQSNSPPREGAMWLAQHLRAALCPPGQGEGSLRAFRSRPLAHPTPTFGCELRRLRAEVPEADRGVSRATRQVPATGERARLSTVTLPCPEPPACTQPLVLSRGAEGNGDDGLGVPLQGAGAAGHCPHPEHRLRLVDDVQHLLCFHRLPRQGLLQRHHDLGIAEEEGQGHRFVLQEKRQEK